MFITTSFQFFHYSAMFSLKEPICLSTQQSNQSQQHQFFFSQSCCFSLWREQLMTKKDSIAFSKVIFSSIIFIFTTKILLSEKLSAQHLFFEEGKLFLRTEISLVVNFSFQSVLKAFGQYYCTRRRKTCWKKIGITFLCFMFRTIEIL